MGVVLTVECGVSLELYLVPVVYLAPVSVPLFVLVILGTSPRTSRRKETTLRFVRSLVSGARDIEKC